MFATGVPPDHPAGLLHGHSGEAATAHLIGSSSHLYTEALCAFETI